MELLYRTAPPAYRGCSPPAQRTGFLGNLWCYLFGSGSAPSYRTADGRNGSAGPTATRCWWQAFPSTPSYETAPPAPPPDDVPDEPDPGDDGGVPCECSTDEETGEDVPSQVYIVTG